MTAEPPSPVSKREMNDPFWRLCNIYWIRSDGRDPAYSEGTAIPFRPNTKQQKVLEAIYILGWRFLIIPKARQLGMSTVIALVCLDSMLFGSGLQISLVDATNPDAKKKLEEKVIFAFDRLEAELRNAYIVETDSQSQFSIRMKVTEKGQKDEQSTFYAGERARGGTNNILWSSEWGAIQMDDKKRSTEILTGALPSSAKGLTIIETTWKGGRGGDLWPLLLAAQNVMKSPKSEQQPDDERFLFFPWYTEPSYRRKGTAAAVHPKTSAYFDAMERAIPGVKFDVEQRLWWQTMKRRYGVFMGREYPTTLEEALDAPNEGAWFDHAGVQFQISTAVSLETRLQYGDIIVTGNRATWVKKPEHLAPFVRIEEPRDGESYLLPVDFSGRKMVAGSTGERDANASCVLKSGRGDKLPQLVCGLQHKDLSVTQETIRRVVAMHILYGNCMVVPETNNKDDIAERLVEAGVTNMYRQRAGVDGTIAGIGKTEEVLGWYTSAGAGGSRKHILDLLEEIVREQKVVVTFGWIADQLSTFIMDEKGRLQAAQGSHDDGVLMLAFGMFNIPHATLYRDARLEGNAWQDDNWQESSPYGL